MTTPMLEQKTQDQLDAARYRKYRAMVIAGLAEPVTTDEFDATMDSAIVPAQVLANAVLWGIPAADHSNH